MPCALGNPQSNKLMLYKNKKEINFSGRSNKKEHCGMSRVTSMQGIKLERLSTKLKLTI